MSVRQPDLLDVVGGIPLFGALTQRQLRGVARECREQRYAPGEVLLRELDWGQHMIALTEGRADVLRGVETIARVGPGDVVGEMSLLDDRPRSAAVIATEAVTGIVLYRTAFRRLLTEHPTMCSRLLLAQTTRLREADRRAAAIG